MIPRFCIIQTDAQFNGDERAAFNDREFEALAVPSAGSFIRQASTKIIFPLNLDRCSLTGIRYGNSNEQFPLVRGAHCEV